MSDVSDKLLVERVRRGEAGAWEQLIDRYEGRLLAFVRSRLNDRTAAEDIVQETFAGFLVGLVHFDERKPLENWLFTIAAHKLTDYLRREGRRPTIPLERGTAGESGGAAELPGSARRASSLVRSGERKSREEQILAECLASLIAQWQRRGEWERLKCAELLFVLGRSNKDVAASLDISEQAVANHKQFVVSKLKKAARQARLDLASWPEFDG